MKEDTLEEIWAKICMYKDVAADSGHMMTRYRCSQEIKRLHRKYKNLLYNKQETQYCNNPKHTL